MSSWKKVVFETTAPTDDIVDILKLLKAYNLSNFSISKLAAPVLEEK